jgi:ribonuclease HI
VDQIYRIFTDGSAIGNPGPGGWGVVVIQGKERWEMSGAHPWTTISEMELVAALQALRSVEGRARIELHSDSEYLIYGMRAFVSRWQRQGWRNRRGTQLQHRELWTELIELNTKSSHPMEVDQRSQRASLPEPCRRTGNIEPPGLSGCNRRSRHNADDEFRSIRRRNTDGIDCGSKLAV